MCTVMDIMKSPETCCRLEIQFDNATCGYLHIRAWKVRCEGEERMVAAVVLLPSV